MPRTIQFQGTTHQFPDDATDDEIRSVLSPPTPASREKNQQYFTLKGPSTGFASFPPASPEAQMNQTLLPYTLMTAAGPAAEAVYEGLQGLSPVLRYIPPIAKGAAKGFIKAAPEARTGVGALMGGGVGELVGGREGAAIGAGLGALPGIGTGMWQGIKEELAGMRPKFEPGLEAPVPSRFPPPIQTPSGATSVPQPIPPAWETPMTSLTPARTGVIRPPPVYYPPKPTEAKGPIVTPPPVYYPPKPASAEKPVVPPPPVKFNQPVEATGAPKRTTIGRLKFKNRFWTEPEGEGEGEGIPPAGPKKGTPMTPEEARADASAALHGTATELDLGTESPAGKNGHPVIARLARELGRNSSKDFTAQENKIIDGLMQQLQSQKRAPTAQEVQQAFQRAGIRQ